VKRSKGLTLVESLIAVTVLSFVMAAVVLLIRGHVNLNRPLLDRADGIHNVRASFDILSRELRHASAIDNGQTGFISFRSVIDGAERSFQYRLSNNRLERQENGGGYQEVTYNATHLDFQYFDLMGNPVPLPVTNLLDHRVAVIVASIGVAIPDQGDTLVLSGRVSPRNNDT
jgi:prepilin-type N-terminal cleavage/methylation domain-containing protein